MARAILGCLPGRALVLLAAVALTSCRREARDPGLNRGATLVMAVPDASVMKPDAWDLDFLTFLPLATLGERGELEGRLARSWEHSADFKEWTYHLRTDVRWDDGKPVTARDVKFTLELLAKAGTGYTGIDAAIVDDSTVRIRAAKPDYIDDLVYYPEHLLKSLDPRKFWEWDFWTHPVGNGPFRFVRYLPERLIEFEANPGYYKRKAANSARDPEVRWRGGSDRIAEREELLAVYVQAQLRQVGVQMEVQLLDPGLHGDRLDAGDFEAVFGGFDVGRYQQQKYLGRDNPIGYRNSEYVRLTDLSMATADPDELDRIYQASTEIFRADLPVTRLVPWTYTYFAHRRLRGLSTPFHARPHTYMEDLWLDEKE